jgi:phenylalanyl-tRNA synthetase alpha chain
MPAQPHPAQPHPAQPHPAQPHPAQPHPARAHPPRAQNAPLSPARIASDLAIRDLTDPASGPHAIQQLVDLAVSALAAAWSRPAGLQVRWCRGPRVVPVADNYDQLGYDPSDVTRAVRYTRYVDAAHMLRSHSTAMVPPALRQLALTQPALSQLAPCQLGAGDAADDVLLVCPGIVYRRDAIDWQHAGTPHQLDLWRISRRPLAPADLDEMISALLAAVVPGRASRSEPRQHPYTTAGRQVDVHTSQGWVEVWECGLAEPGVLAQAGLAGRSGLALGMGLDRLLMLRKEIPDIRLLRSADPQVAVQMHDLALYRPVSRQPSVRRDLSVAVDDAEDAETLGDRIRDALGPDADAVEDVRVLSSAAPGDLPPAALARLGLQPWQRNLLIRVVLRRLDRTLTDAEANLLRDRIYAAIHQGSADNGRVQPPAVRPAAG